MDPFEELTIASRSASQPGRTPATGSPAVQQRLPGRDVASQPAAVGTRQGNPFLDQSEQASANALTVPQPRANAFGVRVEAGSVTVLCSAS